MARRSSNIFQSGIDDVLEIPFQTDFAVRKVDIGRRKVDIEEVKVDIEEEKVDIGEDKLVTVRGEEIQ